MGKFTFRQPAAVQKIKYGNRRNLYINLHLKEDFGMEFTAC